MFEREIHNIASLLQPIAINCWARQGKVRHKLIKEIITVTVQEITVNTKNIYIES